ncbi:hypothetical protein HY990_04800 [Candidatus Micrarchaeota archaeon]|nr:hypothetical protein [Candidatus Micrarchaeota archaeon]
MQLFPVHEVRERPLVAVDHRESIEFDRILTELGAEVKRCQLLVGDFLCSANLAVERKTRADFEQSIIDGRLFSQLPHLIENYSRVVIVVEGTSDESRISRSALLGAYGSIISDYGVSLMFTRDLSATAELVFNFAKHEQIAKRTQMRIYARKKALTPSASARAIAESLPMIGPKSAKNLLLHFGSLDALFRASEKDLSVVSGIGPKRAKIIRAILSYLYQSDSDV